MKDKMLTEEIYKEIVKNSILKNLTLKELINIAINYDKSWDIAGIYFRIIEQCKLSTIIIDRKQSSDGYTESEIQLVIFKDQISSSDPNFSLTIYEEIDKKQQQNKNNNEESFC